MNTSTVLALSQRTSFTDATKTMELSAMSPAKNVLHRTTRTKEPRLASTHSHMADNLATRAKNFDSDRTTISS